ncbi:MULTISPECIES: RDD family protein [Phaeobacter]|uniref:RDD family protein n=2 Tax=Phaeobacter TaxID=302485 RepID=A0AAC9Z723_9RHOB|nr:MULTISPECIES: RDD family protein [Phaeobacter]AHD09148.1 RDD family [Phaeobacter gallaeciensis DSM 26640]ATE92411.1 RDD family protein [Phaeobacter gallaeciensis]ATE97768.1 RDD family protein [Phaeobacter gallaeciensis]ATF01076.1 RDD family protein [Phaeobacter gallaeciensis]ATF05456.1 RDD family protein [Phaeobacter gallaeciensis]
MTALPDPDYQADFYQFVASKRLFAWLIDSVLITLLASVAVVFTAFTGLFIWPLLYLVIGFIYRAVTIAAGSATWGMVIAGIELRDLSGRKLDGQGALLHTAGYSISMAFPVLQVISILMMLMSARGQGLTDAVLGTVMLNRRR